MIYVQYIVHTMCWLVLYKIQVFFDISTTGIRPKILNSSKIKEKLCYIQGDPEKGYESLQRKIKNILSWSLSLERKTPRLPLKNILDISQTLFLQTNSYIHIFESPCKAQLYYLGGKRRVISCIILCSYWLINFILQYYTIKIRNEGRI